MLVNLEETPVLAMYRARKDSKLMCDRLVLPLKDGVKILVRNDWPENEWIEATYCMRKWPIYDDDHDESAGYLYFDKYTREEKWRPILQDDEVRIL
jgi:hypothetical protein